MHKASAVHNSPSKAQLSVALIHTISSPMQIYPLFSAGVELICFPPVPDMCFQVFHTPLLVFQLLLELDNKSTSEEDWEIQQAKSLPHLSNLLQKTNLKPQYFAII